MKTLSELRNLLSCHKKELADSFQVREVGIFGSYARAESVEGSDLDILVDFSRPVGMFKFLELEERLQSLTGLKIDLVSRKGLKPSLADRILAETVFI